jgi:shikimate dehydrogenase/3-dehydroquinate dehydratase type I
MMTLVVASLVERGIAGVSRSSTKAFGAGADLVEVRLDHVAGISRRRKLIDDARAAVNGPAIATYRSAEEGGMGSLKGGRRRDLLRRVIDAGFEYVDLELVQDGALLGQLGAASGSPKSICSYHFARAASAQRVRSRLEEACASAHIGKVAMPCEDAGQAVRLAEIALELKRSRKRFALMGMGLQGQLTRACAKEMGSKLVYACPSGRPAAPGQLELGMQRRLLSKTSVKLGLLGHPVEHSVSGPMQEAALRSTGFDGIYLHLDIPPSKMTRETISTLFELGLDGLNVTIPHKERAFRLSDSRGRSATSTGAVNTLYKRRGRIVGENTDVFGFSKLLEHNKVDVRGGRVLVVGAGGAARAVCEALTNEGAEITVAARRASRAAKLAREFGAGWRPISPPPAGGNEHALVVNSTPIGTRGTPLEAEALPEEMLRSCSVFVDLVYNPEVTRSMEVARESGRRAHGGLEMLVRQGEEAFRIWTGKDPDIARMRLAARRALRA